MMYKNISDLIQQIALGEDSVLELKAVEFSGNKVVGPNKDGMADELAAMANTASGIIVLGVDDKTKEIRGIPAEKLDIVEGWLRSIHESMCPAVCLSTKAQWLFSPPRQLQARNEARCISEAIPATQSGAAHSLR